MKVAIAHWAGSGAPYAASVFRRATHTLNFSPCSLKCMVSSARSETASEALDGLWGVGEECVGKGALFGGVWRAWMRGIPG